MHTSSVFKKIVIIIAVILALIPQTVGSSSNTPDNLVSAQSFITDKDVWNSAKLTGASLEEIRITSYALIDNSYVTKECLEGMAKTYCDMLVGSISSVLFDAKDSTYIQNTYTSLQNKVTSCQLNNTRQAKSTFIIEDIMEGKIILNNSTANTATEGLDKISDKTPEKISGKTNYETCAVVDIVLQSSDKVSRSQLCQISERIKTALEGYMKNHDKNTYVSTTFKLSFNEILDYDQLEKISYRLFEDFNGSIIEGTSDGNYISKTGYSPKVEGGILTQKGIINMNIALRNNNYDKKTYMWFGFPVVNAEY